MHRPTQTLWHNPHAAISRELQDRSTEFSFRSLGAGRDRFRIGAHGSHIAHDRLAYMTSIHHSIARLRMTKVDFPDGTSHVAETRSMRVDLLKQGLQNCSAQSSISSRAK